MVINHETPVKVLHFVGPLWTPWQVRCPEAVVEDTC